MAIGNQTALTPVLRDIINNQGVDPSVIQGIDNSGENFLYFEPSTAVNMNPSSVTAGSGVGEPGFILSAQPQSFDTTQLEAQIEAAVDTADPLPPRRVGATTTYINGVNGENVQNLIVWCAPLVDTTGRWLEILESVPVTGTVYNDSIDYYLVRRENLGTGELVSIAMVSHNKQSVAAARTYLTNQKNAGLPGVTTDNETQIATFDTGLYENVINVAGSPVLDSNGNPVKEVTLGSSDMFFSFNDTTAILGINYSYVVSAITFGQSEGVSVAFVPGEPSAAGGLSLSFEPVWCSTLPTLGAGATGAESYLDLSVTVGPLVTALDVCLIPIQDGAYTLTYTAPLPTDPYVVETSPVLIQLYRPVTGSSTQTIQFVGRNLEAAGGVASLSIGGSVTLATGGVTKTPVPNATTDFFYKLQVTVPSTASLGFASMTLTCGGGKTLTCSQFTILDGTTGATEGATFDYPGQTYRMVTGSPLVINITGKHMSAITGFVMTPANCTATLSNQSFNSVDVTLTNFTGAVTLQAVLTGGLVSTGKDTAVVSVSSSTGGDPKRTTVYPDTDAIRGIPTLTMGR